MLEQLELLEAQVRVDHLELLDRRATLDQPASLGPRVPRVLLVMLGLPDQWGHQVSRDHRDYRVLLVALEPLESREIPDTLEQRDLRDSLEILANRA